MSILSSLKASVQKELTGFLFMSSWNNEESFLLDWNTRFNIALGMAKGMAYLHEECEVKMWQWIECDNAD